LKAGEKQGGYYDYNLAGSGEKKYILIIFGRKALFVWVVIKIAFKNCYPAGYV